MIHDIITDVNERRSIGPVAARWVGMALVLFLSCMCLVSLSGVLESDCGLPVGRRPRHLFPVREEPLTFSAGTYLPPVRETSVSGRFNEGAFCAQTDLVRVDDGRVWWESDNDAGDTEDDHLMNWRVVRPFKTLVELVCRQGTGRLKVQDAYRATGIHSEISLHKEGRALDLTAEGLSLEKLAKLCWAAGFDWVYYEKRGGEHVHCSVKLSRDTRRK